MELGCLFCVNNNKHYFQLSIYL